MKAVELAVSQKGCWRRIAISLIDWVVSVTPIPTTAPTALLTSSRSSKCSKLVCGQCWTDITPCSLDGYAATTASASKQAFQLGTV
jgi:hypothetical protein